MSAAPPELRPCQCGKLPAITENTVSRIHILRVECKCGAFGASMLFTKREHREKMEQAAVDGWNMRL